MIKTAKEIALQIKANASYEQLVNPIIFASLVAIEFAKLHCIEQAKVISEKTIVKALTYGSNCEVDKSSILNAYDLDLIK